MAVTPDYREWILELLRPVGNVSGRAMFGGYGIYLDGLFFALIADDTLYLKVDEDNLVEFESAGLGPFVYVTKDGDRMTMAYRQAPAEALESPAVMVAWARSGYGAALRAKNRKPVRKRKVTE